MTVDKLPAAKYAEAMTAPLVAVAFDAGALGIRPRYLQAVYNPYRELEYGRPFEVNVQTETVADCDRLATRYLLDEDSPDRGNYTREGVATLPGIGDVEVRVYTGRPDDDGAEVTA